MPKTRSVAHPAGDQVPIRLISESDLVASGLWSRAGEIVAVVEHALCAPPKGWHTKAVLAPTNEQTVRLLGIPSETRQQYAGVNFEYKLNVLSALQPTRAGFKAIGANALNRQHGLPRSCALYVLYDPLTLRPRTIVRSALLSALRTAAYACIVRDRCAAPVVAVLGSGRIASALARLWTVRTRSELREVRVYSPHMKPVEFRRSVGPAPYRLTAAPSAEDAVRGADMIVTATTAARPVFEHSWVGPAVVHLNLGGPEAPLDFVERCARTGSVIADTLDGTLHRGAQSLALWWAGQHPAPVCTAHGFTTPDWESLDRPWHVNCVGRPDLDISVAEWGEGLAKEAGRGQDVTL